MVFVSNCHQARGSPAFLCHSGLWKSIPHMIWTCSTPCSHGVLTLTIPGHHVWVGSSGRPQERLQSEHFPPQPRQTRTEMPRTGQCRTNTKTHCRMFLFWTGAYCIAQADMELTMSSGQPQICNPPRCISLRKTDITELRHYTLPNTCLGRSNVKLAF